MFPRMHRPQLKQFRYDIGFGVYTGYTIQNILSKKTVKRTIVVHLLIDIPLDPLILEEMCRGHISDLDPVQYMISEAIHENFDIGGVSENSFLFEIWKLNESQKDKIEKKSKICPLITANGHG